MAPLTQLQGFQYFEVNFHNVDFDVLIDAVVPEPVDVVLVLSLYRNVDIDHRDRMFAYALRRARVGVVIEGHADSVIDTEQFYRRVLFDHGAAPHRRCPHVVALLGCVVLCACCLITMYSLVID
jgi:hypothetical protein